MGRKVSCEYAYYVGDEFIDIGTADYLNERYGVSRSAICNATSPSGVRKRATRTRENVNRCFFVKFPLNG